MSINENLNAGLESQNESLVSNNNPVEKKETSEDVTEDISPNESSTGEKIVSEENVITETQTSDQNVEENEMNSETEGQTNDDEVVSEKKEEKKMEIPEEDYTSMTQEQLVDSLKKLSKNYPVQLVKTQVEEVRTQFNKNFDEKAAASKEQFIAEGGNEIDFYFTTPLKRTFNDLYFEYKEKKNKYYKALKTNLENNLKHRKELIEKLKELVTSTQSTGQKFNVFNELKEEWYHAGGIPRDHNNTVWNTWHHYVDQFYDIVHLDREFRDRDYKQNLEQKIKILERAKELTQYENVNAAFRELQVLHRVWKEEIGPVAKEHKEIIWEKFSELTKEIHDKRHQYFEEQDSKQEENLEKRKEIIAQINTVAETPRSNHNEWQQAMKEVNELHDAFKKAGRVPAAFKNSIWDEFRGAERNFNKLKNEFYKHVKSDQLDNLRKKRDLIATAEANKDSDDFEIVTPLMKRIQSEWKKIGHVPRKDSDKIWKQFKDACNHYFDRIHNKKEEANAEQETAFEKKQAFLEELKTTEVTDLISITSKIEEWKTIGSVPYKKRKIEEEFSTALDELFAKLNINKKEAELIKFETKLADIKSQEDDRLLRDEKNFIRKKMDEAKAEILQLQNNLQFFKHADESNPMVIDVNKNIAKHERNLEIWQAKWTKIKSL